jgi:hypothetical protein
MRLLNFLSLLHIPSTAIAAGFCPPLGPVFPPPKALSTNSVFRTSLTNLESSILNAFKTGTTPHGPLNPNDTYSIQIFSTSDDVPLLDLHHRGTELVSNGTVNGDSIYRIASTSKIVTIYLLLLQAGDAIFNDAVTQHVPELAGQDEWDAITVGALAGYMAGIAGDGKSPTDVLRNGEYLKCHSL